MWALIPQFHQRHRSSEFRQFRDAVDAAVPRHLEVHLIMDHYGTHTTPSIRNWFAKRPRFTSWVHRRVAQLKTAIREFIAAHQANPRPFIWTKSADEILARFAQRTLDLQAAPCANHAVRTLATAEALLASPGPGAYSPAGTSQAADGAATPDRGIRE